MKRRHVLGFAILFVAVAAGLTAEPLTLINTLADRPVFTVVSAGVAMTRTVAPGNRIRLEAGLFSGLGDKQVPLSAGATYYLARFGALPGLYRLAPGQVLILNQAGRAVPLTLEAEPKASAVLANGNLALGALGADGSLTVRWREAPGDGEKSLVVKAEGVYRLVLDSPGGETGVSLVGWD